MSGRSARAIRCQPLWRRRLRSPCRQVSRRRGGTALPRRRTYLGRAWTRSLPAIPEVVFIEIDAATGRNEADPEIRELLLASTSLNLALDYLPGSFSFDPAVDLHVGDNLASRIVWFDAYVADVDRSPRNPNLLWWQEALYCIDHGASLYFHHNARSLPEEAARTATANRSTANSETSS
jgi:hypothetical protein